jgi:hypothetical protein
MHTTKTIAFLLLLAFVALPATGSARPNEGDQCLTCHRETGDKVVPGYLKDIHFAKGISCAGCHGGDSKIDDQDKAMDRSKGYIGKPSKGAIAAMCGKCHGNDAYMKKYNASAGGEVLDEYNQSVHAKTQGEPNGVQCISCHGVHGILAKANPASPVNPLNVPKTCAKCHGDIAYMRTFNPSMPVDQYEKYLTSVHGKNNSHGDPKVATCASCHSNHRILPVKDPGALVYPSNVPVMCAKCHGNAAYMASYKIPTDQYDKYRQSVHGQALLGKGDISAPSCNSCHGNHGAAPPGVSSVSNVCGTCHAFNADLFTKGVHKAVFDKQNLPECGECHSNHLVRSPSDTLVGMGPGSACGKCHQDNGSDKAAGVIKGMRAILDSLSLGQVHAVGLLNSSEQLGMDVSDARYSLKDVNQALVQARVKVHAFALDPLQEAAAPGLHIVASAQKAAFEATSEYYFRRQGLGVATLVISALAIALYLKIRSIERKS